MKTFKKITSNQIGMSLVVVLGAITLGLAGITYLIKEAVPKLQSEKKKIDSQLSYRMFISSVNDYLVHAIRERWCINYENGESDLLLSTKCSSTTSMEDIVTYPGNLERILWSADSIGTKLTSPPQVESANKILALNYLRYNSSPKKTSRLLDYNDIAPKDGILSFKITEKKFKDMNENHPLFIMSRKILECVNAVDIEVFQVRDFSNLASGDERKIGIKINTDIKGNKLSCLAVKRAESVSYYTFYPRRLHTFSLVKYGDLSGNYYNEFHGPVYVAGDFILPPKDAIKDKTTVFYNSLTLGVFNGGSKTNTLKPGTVQQTNKVLYTFPERGHPYKSKQDYYDGFRGFLGGLKLDSSEDKGLHNLFDHNSTTAADTSKLEACIEDNQSILNKSKNVSSSFLYNLINNSSNETLFKLSFDKKNRFAVQENTARITSVPRQNEKNKPSYYKMVIDNANKDAVAEVSINMKFSEGSFNEVSESYQATLGDGTNIKLALNFEKYDLTQKNIDSYIDALNKITKDNYRDAVKSDVITKSTPYINYGLATRNLVIKCNNKVTIDCASLGYNVPKCIKRNESEVIETIQPKNTETRREQFEEEKEGRKVPEDNCNTSQYPNELNQFNTTRSELISTLNNLKRYQNQKETSLEISIKEVAPINGETVLNQRNFSLKTPVGWQEYHKLIYGDLKSFDIDLTPYHFGSTDSLKFEINMMSSNKGNDPRVISKKNFFSTVIENLKNNWNDTRTNNSAPTPTPMLSLKCPQGMNMADWDLDMSPSTNFAWNYANTPAGAFVDTNDHQQAAPIIFNPGTPPLEGHAYSTTKSVVEECIIPAQRTHIYGFYVCKKLTIQDRTTPLYMIGTFIVEDLSIPRGLSSPIHWYSIWDTKATDLIMTDLNANKSNCNGVKDLTSKTWKDIIVSPHIAATVESCGPLDLVSNGPNNFSWTTVDPDVGIGAPGDVMTSQKVNRIQKWVIREESRSDLIR